MTGERNENSNDGSFTRSGAIAAALGGLLFLVFHLLEFLTGPPPAEGAKILAWVASSRLGLSLTNETLMFAGLSLIPVTFVLYRRLQGFGPAKVALACGLYATTVPVFVMLVIVQGRLVYPVFDIEFTSPEIAEFVIALYYGGLHAVDLILAAATILLARACQADERWKSIAIPGYATGVLSILGSYPYLIGPTASLVCHAAFAVWLLLVSAKLYATAAP